MPEILKWDVSAWSVCHETTAAKIGIVMRTLTSALIRATFTPAEEALVLWSITSQYVHASQVLS